MSVRTAQGLFVAAAMGAPLALAAPACGASEVADPSYMLVELIPAETAPMPPRAAHVRVAGADATVTTLCVSIDGPAGVPAASFVLSRDPGRPAADPVTLEITAYEALSGVEGAAPGKEFVCPSTLPPALVAPQVVLFGFCERQSRRVVVHVGATCACAGDGGAGGGASGCCTGEQTCGAGLTSTGQACGADTCCSSSITSPCALEGT